MSQYVAAFDRVVSDMMRKFGTRAQIVVALEEEYDVETSENTVRYQEYPVNALFFDYIDKMNGLTSKGNTLIQTGDKQVYVQPPNKMETGVPLPHLNPNRDTLRLDDMVYKIITFKQHNPSMTSSGSVLYELYVRE